MIEIFVDFITLLILSDGKKEERTDPLKDARLFLSK